MICVYSLGKDENSKTTVKVSLNYMKIIQTEWRSKFSEVTLEPLFCLKLEGLELSKFTEIFCSRTATLWWNDKERHIN